MAPTIALRVAEPLRRERRGFFSAYPMAPRGNSSRYRHLNKGATFDCSGPCQRKLLSTDHFSNNQLAKVQHAPGTPILCGPCAQEKANAPPTQRDPPPPEPAVAASHGQAVVHHSSNREVVPQEPSPPEKPQEQPQDAQPPWP